MQDKLFKGGLAGLGAIISYLTGNFTPLIYLLIFFEFADYITGMYSAIRADGWQSKVAIEGFFKKVFYFFLVAVAFGFDYMIYEATNLMSIDFTYPAVFGILAVCYLLSTELISVTENLQKIGIAVPFMTKALKMFRDKIEKMGDKSK